MVHSLAPLSALWLYQVCQKWLKDRKGRTLTADDRTHYQKIIIALSETIRLMAEIDTVIAQHGGWPDAFKSAAAGGTSSASPEAPAAPPDQPDFR